MSFIAAIACIILVVKLLQMDHQASPGLSKVLWVPTTWFLYCATRPLSEWAHFGPQSLAGGGAQIESGSVVDRNFLTGLLVISLVILHKRRFKWSQAIKNNFWLFALLFFMLASVLWSDFQFVSLKRWVRTAGTAVVALVVLGEAEPYEAIHAILRRTVYVIIPFSALLVKYFPTVGILFGRWSGVPVYAGATLNKNTLGEVCMLCIYLHIWTMVRRREKEDVAPPVKGRATMEWLVLFLALFLMKGPSGYGATEATYSATCIAALVVGLAVFFTMRRFKARLGQLGRKLAITIVGAGLLMATMDLLNISPMGIVAGAMGRKADLTGRSDLIWPLLLPIAWQHPVLGGGYGSFWITPVRGLTLDVNEAHNGYLDVFVELGVTGLLLLVMVVVTYFKKARKELQENFNWAAFRISYLVMFLLHNWTETTLLRSREILWSLFVLFLVVFPTESPAYRGEESVAEDQSSFQEADSPRFADPAGV
jgi:exopolysaccharide production protein ExoQ